jgi:hypothetical protein
MRRCKKGDLVRVTGGPWSWIPDDLSPGECWQVESVSGVSGEVVRLVLVQPGTPPTDRNIRVICNKRWLKRRRVRLPGCGGRV